MATATVSMKQMCEDIAAELTKRQGETITGEQVFHMDPRGELFPVFELYWSFFPERLPRDVENPEIGVLRYQGEFIEVWNGKENGWQRA